jgi:nicotinate (nicotinamide) nucleotide adenylyltransferase
MSLKYPEAHLTPVTKLLANLSLLKSQSPSKQPVVLVTTGSFNPIHRQHFNNFEIAKRDLESRQSNFKVIAGYISPSQDLYVKGKLGKYAIPIDKRIEMCKLAVEESNWIDIDSWESKSMKGRQKFISHTEVLHRLSIFLNEHEEISSSYIRVFYLCGSDFYLRAGIYHKTLKLGQHGYFVVGREKDDTWIKNTENRLDRTFGKGAWKGSVILLHGEGDIEVSSTLIRKKLLLSLGDWEDLCDPKVVKYIKDNRILKN